MCVPLGLATAGGPKSGKMAEMGRERAKREKKSAIAKQKRSWNFMVGCGGGSGGSGVEIEVE